MQEYKNYKTFKEWSSEHLMLALYQVEESFDYFLELRISELEALQEKCETGCEKQANIRVINELKRLGK